MINKKLQAFMKTYPDSTPYKNRVPLSSYSFERKFVESIKATQELESFIRTLYKSKFKNKSSSSIKAMFNVLYKDEDKKLKDLCNIVFLARNYMVHQIFKDDINDSDRNLILDIVYNGSYDIYVELKEKYRTLLS